MTTVSLPQELQLEVTGACNLRCRMCLVRYRPPVDRVRGSMSFEEFRRAVDAVPDLRRVTLQGLGEPLLAPDLGRMLAYARERGIDVGFNTNATVLTRERAAMLVDAAPAWLHVSVDGARPETYEAIRDGARFETVVRNIRGLVDEMRRRGATRPSLCVVFVAQRSNVADLPDLVRLVADWGIPNLRVQNLSHDFSDTDGGDAWVRIRSYTATETLWDRDPAVQAVFAEAARVAAEVGVDLRLPDEPAAEPRAPGSPGCDWPWRATYVTYDGKVQPCCMVMGSERAVLGDLGTDDLGAVWSGDAYAAFRERLLGDNPPAVCRGCSVYRGVF